MIKIGITNKTRLQLRLLLWRRSLDLPLELFCHMLKTVPASFSFAWTTNIALPQIETNSKCNDIRTVPTIPEHQYASQPVLHLADGLFRQGWRRKGEIGRNG